MTPASALLFARSSSVLKPIPAVNSRRTTRRRALATCLLLALPLGGAAAGPLQAQTAQFAGAVTALGGSFNQPQGVGVDKNRNVYVADTSNGLVEEIPLGCTSQNCVTTLGGGLNQPRSVAVDTSGNVYVADFANQAVYEMPAGCTSTNYNNNLCTITTLVDEKRAPGNTLIGNPAGVAVDGSGNVYFADFNHVYQVPVGCTSQTCVTLLGGGFDQPRGVSVDASGNVYVNDNAGTSVYKMSVGCTAANYTNNLCTIATLGGGLSYPYGVAVDGNGDVYVANAGEGEIQEIPPGCTSANYANNLCTITTLGGGFSGSNGVAVDQSGNVYVADTGNNAVKEIALHGVNFGSLAVGQKSTPMTLYFTFTGASATSNVSESALTLGVEGLDFLDVGTGTCHSNRPPYTYNPGDTCTVDVTFSPKFAGTRSGAADLFNSANSVIATAYVYGMGVAPQLAFSPFTQTALGGGFASPYGVTVDAGGNIYVADSDSSVVYQMPAGCSSSSCVTPIGGGFGTPESVALDGAGNVYVADDVGIHDVEEIPVGCGSSTCLQSMTGGIGWNFAVALDGSGDVFFISSGYRGNGVYELPLGCPDDGCITYRGGFNEPMGLVVDANDNIYVADTGNNAVKEMPVSCLLSNGITSQACTITTLGGGFSGPTGVALDAGGNIYVADYGNGAVKEMPAGCLSSSCVTTVPGSFVHPRGVALDQNGNIYVADPGNPPQSNPAVYELTVTTPPSFSFANTNVGSQSTDSPQIATVRNIGNAPLSFPAPGTGENPSVAANFTLDSATTCPEVSNSSSVGALAAGATCSLAVDFIPTTAALISGQAVLTDNNLDANPAMTQSIGLIGTGVQPTVNVTIGTSPAGLSFSINGTPYTSTQTQSLTVGTAYALNTTATQPGGTGVQYVFSQWSDGTTTTSDPLEPTISTTSDTAEFTTQYLLTVSAGTNGAIAAATAPSVFYNSGTVQTIAATPNPGYYFVNWTGAASPTDIASLTSATTTVTMNGPEPLTAIFAPIPNYVVTTLTDDGNGQPNTAGIPGNCPAAPATGIACTLRDALTAAGANSGGAGNISFASGLNGTITINGAMLPIYGQIVIKGPGANIITLSGGGTNQIFNINAGTYTISGLTLANAWSGANGGGFYMNPGANVTIASCVFSGDIANAGGAIYNQQGTLMVADSTFSTNSTTGNRGAAIYNNLGTLTVSYSTFYSNTSPAGGGAIAAFGPATIVNSTFSNNQATRYGGAIFTSTPSLTLSNNIIAGNSASSLGAAIYAGSSLDQVIASNNLFYQNYDTGATTEDDCHNCALTPVNPVSGNPNLAPPGNYGGTTPTMLPLPASAAICAGSSALIPTGVTTDQRGLPNSTTYNGTPCNDLGAIQTNYSLSFTSTPPATGTVPGTAMSPQTVTVDESGNLLTGGSASVSVTDTNSDLTTTPATAATTSGVATFSALIFTGPSTSDTLAATLTLNPNLPSLILTSVPSGSFKIGQISQTITFTGLPPTTTYTLPNATYALNASASSGLPITYGVTGPASISGTSLTITGAGQVIVTASQTGNTNYSAATPVSLTINVGQASQTIAFTGLPSAAIYTSPNATYALNASASSGLSITYGITGPGTISGTTLTITGAGQIAVTASQTGNTNYKAATSVSLTIKVGQASQIITLASVPAATTYGNGPYTLNATASSGLPVSYTVSGPATLATTVTGTILTITGAGNVIITENQAGNTNYLKAPTATQTIAVTAVPLASISPGSINFGTLYLGSIVTKAVTITNVGDAPMTIKDPLIAIVQGGNSNEFITVNLCPASLAAGKSCNMTVTFVAGPFYAQQTATLTINDNVAGSPQTVMLTATVIDPVPAFSATSLSFGTVKTGTASAAKSITVTNVGGTALAIGQMAFAGADPGDFSQTNTCTASLAPKGICTISVTFKPGTKGARSASLVVTDNAFNSVQSIPLSGTGN
jgi:CSLREA domain-containing protein